jgi:hypothetical protein
VQEIEFHPGSHNHGRKAGRNQQERVQPIPLVDRPALGDGQCLLVLDR